MKIRLILLCVIILTAYFRCLSQTGKYIIYLEGDAFSETTNTEVFTYIFSNNCDGVKFGAWVPRDIGGYLQHQRVNTINIISSPSVSEDYYYDMYSNEAAIIDFTGHSASTYTINMESNVEVFVDLEKVKVNDRYPVDKTIPAYLSVPFSYLYNDAPIVRTKALELANNCKTIKSVVREFSMWIDGNIEYVLDKSQRQDAHTVYNKKKAYCVGFSAIMVAMLRSVDIPARFNGVVETGHAYNIIVQWTENNTIYTQTLTTGSAQGAHSLYEVYFPSIEEWVRGDAQGNLYYSHQNSIITNVGPDFLEGDYAPDEITTLDGRHNQRSWILYPSTCGTLDVNNSGHNISSVVNDDDINYSYADKRVPHSYSSSSFSDNIFAVDESSEFFIRSTKKWNDAGLPNYLEENVYICNNGTLTLDHPVELSPTAYIIIESGGEFIIDGGSVTNGNIKAEDNGTLALKNNAIVYTYGTGSFEIADGANLIQDDSEIRHLGFEAFKINTPANTNRNVWHTQTLSSSYSSSPIIILGTPSYNDPSPAVMRVNAKGTTSFSYSIQEWDYLPNYGQHGQETLGCLVIRPGRYDFGGLKAQAFSSDTRCCVLWPRGTRTFSEKPVIFAQVSSRRSDEVVTARIAFRDENSFYRKIQEQEQGLGIHVDERVDYLAIEPGSGEENGHKFEVGTINVNSSFTIIHFTNTYTNPIFIAQIQSINDQFEPCALRYKDLTSSSVKISVQEEQSKDSEMTHGNEVVGYMVYEK